jgi:uncharacterized membrane protein YdbT with pleckstrin-like domain
VAYPRRLLQEGEEVVLDLHPHWRRIFFPVLSVPVVVALAAFAAAELPDRSWRGNARWGLLALAVVILLFTFVRPWLRWITTSYVVTTHRVVLRDGVLARSGRDIPLSRINDVTFEHSVIERLLRSGTLLVESAGERGQVTLADVPRVENVQRTLYQLVEKDDLRRRGYRDDRDDRDDRDGRDDGDDRDAPVRRAGRDDRAEGAEGWAGPAGGPR